MRIVPLFAVLALAGLGGCASHPHDTGRWCSVVNTGADDIARDCNFDSVEECRQNVITGNRGFCVQNSNYRAGSGPGTRHRYPRQRRN